MIHLLLDEQKACRCLLAGGGTSVCSEVDHLAAALGCVLITVAAASYHRQGRRHASLIYEGEIERG